MSARRKKIFSVAALALTVLWHSASYAESSDATAPAAAATSTSTNTSFKERYLKNVSASHSLELYNSTTKALSGNTDGQGNNLLVAHYTQVAYKLPNHFGVSVTNLLFQTFNRDRDNDKINFSDPYVTLSNSQILNNGDKGFNLFGYFRYYAPISGGTREAVLKGSANDQGNGKIRVVLAPSQTLFGGKMEASVATSFYYRIAKNSAAEREALTGNRTRNDAYAYYAPNLAWNVNDKTQLYVEYFSGLIKHSSDGKTPRGRKESDGETIAFGANLTPNKLISLTPSIAWGPKFHLNDAAVGFFTTIKLL